MDTAVLLNMVEKIFGRYKADEYAQLTDDIHEYCLEQITALEQDVYAYQECGGMR